VRRLPVYILLDTSGSMFGEPIQATNVGLRAMMSALRQDPHALEAVHVSIITADREAKVVVPLTPLDELILPEIVAPRSAPTLMGLGLETLVAQVSREVVRSTPDKKGDWMPLLFVMTDGSPTDLAAYDEQVAVIKKMKFGSIIGCAAGPKAKKEKLLELTSHVVSLDNMDSASFGSFFKWVSSAVSSGSQSMGATVEVVLPPPPPEIQIVA
jgi:uncharacterized protein YegL